MRNQLASWLDTPFFLVVSEDAPMRVLRAMDHHVERPAVTQAARDREPALDESPIDDDPIDLEARVRASLAKRHKTLAAVVADVLPEIAKERQYASIGQIAAYVAGSTNPQGTQPRPWVAVPDGFEIEDWRLGEDDVQ